MGTLAVLCSLVTRSLSNLDGSLSLGILMSCVSVPDSGDRPLSFLEGEEVKLVSSYAELSPKRYWRGPRSQEMESCGGAGERGGGGARDPSVSNTKRHHQRSVLH